MQQSGKKARKDRAKEVAAQAGDNVSGHKSLHGVMAGEVSDDTSDDSSEDTDNTDPFHDDSSDSPNTDSSDSDSSKENSPILKRKRARHTDQPSSSKGAENSQPKSTEVTVTPTGSVCIVPGASAPVKVPPVMQNPNTPFPVRQGFNIPKTLAPTPAGQVLQNLPQGTQVTFQPPATPPRKKRKKSKKSKQKENILSKLNRSGKIRKHYSLGYLLGKGASWDEFYGFFPYCKQAGIFDSDKATFHDWGYILSKEAELEANKKKDVDDLNKKPGVLTELDLRYLFSFYFEIYKYFSFPPSLLSYCLESFIPKKFLRPRFLLFSTYFKLISWRMSIKYLA